jgi:hypothetical protein
VFAQWPGTLTYARRVSAMQASLTAKGADDAEADGLTGAAGLDWFFARLEGGTADLLTDRITAEVVTAL